VIDPAEQARDEGVDGVGFADREQPDDREQQQLLEAIAADERPAKARRASSPVTLRGREERHPCGMATTLSTAPVGPLWGKTTAIKPFEPVVTPGGLR
jgi:hypothetical protein